MRPDFKQTAFKLCICLYTESGITIRPKSPAIDRVLCSILDTAGLPAELPVSNNYPPIPVRMRCLLGGEAAEQTTHDLD